MSEQIFRGLEAIYINATLKKSPQESYTENLIKISRNIMEKNGVKTELIRLVDYDVAHGVFPDMREHGWSKDDWPQIQKKIMTADILVLSGPIWLGDNSSVMKKVIERLYASSAELNEKGQSIYYGRTGGCLISGNEDGIKHCAMYVLYSLQHIGYIIPPQADAGWIGEAGPGPSYGEMLDNGFYAGFSNDFTNRNVTFMTWNLMHTAKMLKDRGGFPARGNQMDQWNDGKRFGFERPE